MKFYEIRDNWPTKSRIFKREGSDLYMYLDADTVRQYKTVCRQRGSETVYLTAEDHAADDWHYITDEEMYLFNGKPVPEAKPKTYAHYLPLHGYNNLDLACTKLVRAYGWSIYLVGSSLVKPNYRDVDVRCLLDDWDFDKMFRIDVTEEINMREHKKLIELGISTWLKQQTGLEIDFQFQRVTEANKEYPRSNGRSSLGLKFSVTNPERDVQPT